VTDETTVRRFSAIACELVVRVRDDEPEDNAEWLARRLPDPSDWFRLAFVLAAAVPDDRSWKALTAWTVAPEPRRLQPHGTQAAAARHRYHGERLCQPCQDAERVRDRDRKRAARSQPQAA
jgi:hypothetical protein